MWRGYKTGVVGLMLVTGSCIPMPTWAQSPGATAWGDPTVAGFVDVLSPYGEWFDMSPYGTVWRPYAHYVGADFIPYASYGHWVYSNVGWIFVSYLPWGWATFHYGRWMLHPYYGWLWVPGLVWAPAWVAWRFGGGFVGWSPLPPPGYPGWDWGRGGYWCFSHVDGFTHPHVRRHLESWGAPPAHLRHDTQPLPIAGGGPEWPMGPARDAIERERQQPVPVTRVDPPPPDRIAPPDYGGDVHRTPEWPARELNPPVARNPGDVPPPSEHDGVVEPGTGGSEPRAGREDEAEPPSGWHPLPPPAPDDGRDEAEPPSGWHPMPSPAPEPSSPPPAQAPPEPSQPGWPAHPVEPPSSSQPPPASQQPAEPPPSSPPPAQPGWPAHPVDPPKSSGNEDAKSSGSDATQSSPHPHAPHGRPAPSHPGRLDSD